MSVEKNKDFKPSESLKSYYRVLSSFIIIIPILVTIGTLLGTDFETATIASIITWAIFLPIYLFILYWIPEFYDSISYRLSDSEVVVEKGVWIKNIQNIPYKQIMNIGVKQGPLYRHFDLGKVEIQTAGRSGSEGGPEASIFGVKDFKEVKNRILEIVRGKKETEETKTRPKKEEPTEVLDEVRKIRKILEKSNNSK